MIYATDKGEVVSLDGFLTSPLKRVEKSELRVLSEEDYKPAVTDKTIKELIQERGFILLNFYSVKKKRVKRQDVKKSLKDLSEMSDAQLIVHLLEQGLLK